MNFSCTIRDTRTEVTYTDDIAALLASYSDALYVFDEHTIELVPRTPARCCIIRSGEVEKHLGTVERILEQALSCELGRDALFIAVGGGVVCDITAFAASVYMRGVRAILIPTTLLAMVDASLGGKSGVDFHSFKNLVGSFYPAERVVIHTPFISTIPENEYLNGLAEIIKHALLVGGALYERVKSWQSRIMAREPAAMQEIIHESLLVKKEFIEADPHEKVGIRAKLNLGHTFAHAYESMNQLAGIGHGQAVAWGIARALTAGVLMGVTDSDYCDEVIELLSSYGYRLDLPIGDRTAFIQALRHDKKNREGQVTFILQRGIGDTFPGTIPDSILDQLL